ncbi:hypothetical protein Lal_00026340 [Lupinus albus]|nr:hypothetical protein Lal_00026340 [Lupinus albus]
MEIGEWRVESGEWRVESGEWRVESGEWRVESGEWRVESGEWRVESGEWRYPRDEGDAVVWVRHLSERAVVVGDDRVRHAQPGSVTVENQCPSSPAN